jgi:hypothetical protein
MAEDDLRKFIEKKSAQTGATQRKVWKELDDQADLWEQQARSQGLSPIQRGELRQLVHRAGSILHYFHHGYAGDSATAEDRRLVELIRSMPKG